ncbi:MAG: hypothetical protein L3K19_02875 [Thermoplasmata archaeon]|nr:hypothetical protein [Thermoplasmata archaeon]
MAAEPIMAEDDSSHVPALYRSVVSARHALGWYAFYATAWLGVLILLIPVTGFIIVPPSVSTSQGVIVLGFLVAGFFLSFLLLLPLGIVALRRWTTAVRELEVDLPVGSTWRDEVVGPAELALRDTLYGVIASAGFGVGILVMLLVLGDISASPDSGPDALAIGETVFFAVTVLLSALQVAVHLRAIRAIMIPISGSGIPAIDLDRSRAYRTGAFLLPAIFAPEAVIGVGLAFPGFASDWIGYVAWVGLLAPVGLLGAVFLLRRAFVRWIHLADRLVGPRQVV